jgi:hypothetical protein
VLRTCFLLAENLRCSPTNDGAILYIRDSGRPVGFNRADSQSHLSAAVPSLPPSYAIYSRPLGNILREARPI